MKPDFVGTWFKDEEANFFGYGQFEFFIQERKKTNKEKESIAGIIEDWYGIAFFEGELSDKKIKFTKTYSQEAIDNGGHWDKIEYEGENINGTYKGEYTVINGTSNGIKKDWKREFIMREYSDPSLN